MKISANLDALIFQKFLERYPHAIDASMNVFRDRVGFKLENSAKKIAPHSANHPRNRNRKNHGGGNLRRQIFYSRSAGNGSNATLYSYAEYSKYVHGAPYYKNRIKRRETPFFTLAIRDNRSFIRDEQRAMLKRVLK